MSLCLSQPCGLEFLRGAAQLGCVASSAHIQGQTLTRRQGAVWQPGRLEPAKAGTPTQDPSCLVSLRLSVKRQNHTVSIALFPSFRSFVMKMTWKNSTLA